MTLEQLKQQNEESTQEESEQEPKAEFLQVDDEPEVEPKAETESLGADDEEEAKEEALEPWMQSEEQDSHDSESVPLAAHIKLRAKLKDEVKERDSELEQLRKKIEALESAPATKPIAATGKPKREDFYEHDDPEEAFAEALVSWKLDAREQERTQEATIKQQQEAQAKAQAEIEKGLESHYQRAQQLLTEHKIDASVYQSADKGFREAIEQVMPTMGDAITDSLIAQIGEGSEKLVMYVGRSDARKAAFQAAFASDKSGLKAMRLIGKWEGEIEAPKKRVSQAPKPSVNASGDASGESTASEKKLKKAYLDAHKKSNAQAAFDAKQAARKANYNVDDW